MSEMQRKVLVSKIDSLVRFGESIGFNVSKSDYNNIIVFYENKVINESYDSVIRFLTVIRLLATKSNIGDILSSIINNSKKDEKVKKMK